MNINRTDKTEGVDYYNGVSSNEVSKVETEKAYNNVEFYETSKILKDYSIDNTYDNRNKVLEVKNKIENGTYCYDSRIIAKGMLDIMRGKE